MSVAAGTTTPPGPTPSERHDPGMTDRQIALESKIATLERTVDQLAGELAAHQFTIDRLQQDLAALVQHLRQGRAAHAGEAIEPHDTPPPHWGGGA
jgi:uncharacterized coiled-coil protein SlyX